MDAVTVRQLTEYIRYVLKDEFILQNIEVCGEVSNLSRNKSGNVYFTLKDDAAILRCVIWKTDDMNLELLEEGHEIHVLGSIVVVERMGSYQLVVRDLKTKDIGELYKRFEKLKEVLFKEGLFDADQKKPIPKYPFNIGIATSDTGAAVRDIITTLHRRFSCANIFLYPTIVQGENAPASILRALLELDKRGLDLIIVGRGGGSFEDLAAFSDESVVRAIAKMKTPVISAVGHEIDNQLSDAVADLRAATPTAAAEIATPKLDDLLDGLARKKRHMKNFVMRAVGNAGDQLMLTKKSMDRMNPEIMIETATTHLAHARKTIIFYNPLDRMEREREKLFFLNKRMDAHSPRRSISEIQEVIEHQKANMKCAVKRQLKSNQRFLSMQNIKLALLNPENVLAKGYSILTTMDGGVVDTVDVKIGSVLKARLYDGTLTLEVKDKEV